MSAIESVCWFPCRFLNYVINFLINWNSSMTSRRCKFDDDVNAVGILECMLCNACQTIVTISAIWTVRNVPMTPQILQTALEEVTKPPLRAHGEDMPDAVAEPPESDKRLALKTRPTHNASLARLESTVCEEVASVLALVEDAVVPLLGEAASYMESIQDTKMISLIDKVVRRALPRGFQSAAYCSAVEETIRKRVSKSRSVEAEAIVLGNAPALSSVWQNLSDTSLRKTLSRMPGRRNGLRTCLQQLLRRISM